MTDRLNRANNYGKFHMVIPQTYDLTYDGPAQLEQIKAQLCDDT